MVEFQKHYVSMGRLLARLDIRLGFRKQTAILAGARPCRVAVETMWRRPPPASAAVLLLVSHPPSRSGPGSVASQGLPNSLA